MFIFSDFFLSLANVTSIILWEVIREIILLQRISFFKIIIVFEISAMIRFIDLQKLGTKIKFFSEIFVSDPGHKWFI